MKIDKSVICCINVGFKGALNRSSKEQPTKKPARKHGAKKGGRDEWEISRSGRDKWETSRQKYSNIPPQTHGGLRETILSLEVKARKGLGERGLVKISASWS